MSVYSPGKLSHRKWRAVAEYLEASESAGFTPLLLLAASPETGVQIMDSLDGAGDVDTRFLRKVLYYSDYKTLISLNRSNGGATYFSEGFLVRKWSFKALPNSARVGILGTEDPTEPMLSYSTVGNLSFQAFLLYAFAVMLLL